MQRMTKCVLNLFFFKYETRPEGKCRLEAIPNAESARKRYAVRMDIQACEMAFSILNLNCCHLQSALDLDETRFAL